MQYKVRQLANGRYGVYAYSEYSEMLVKTFKTERGAKNWITRH